MADYHAVQLSPEDGSYTLELVPEYPGVINRLLYRDSKGIQHDLLAGSHDRHSLQTDVFYRGALLYPFVNRLDAGQYRYQDRDYQFAVNEPERNTSLHGFLCRMKPEIRDLQQSAHQASALLHYDYQGQFAAYPFPAEISVLCQLDHQTGLTMTMQVRNCHDQPVPLAIGWHPYFTLGEKVDDLQLKLPAGLRVAVDERLLPTGERLEFDDFSSARRIGDFTVDDCMALNLDSEKVSAMLWSEQQSRGIVITQQTETYPYLHLFIPPDRQSIALEPVSGGINAFVSGENLVHLAPGKVFSASCSVRHISEPI